MGDSATADGNSSTAVGGESVADGAGTTAFGWQSSATGERAHAFGHLAEAGGDYSLAIGEGASANFANAVAIGYGASASADNEFVLGNADNDYTLPGLSGDVEDGTYEFVVVDDQGGLQAISAEEAQILIDNDGMMTPELRSGPNDDLGVDDMAMDVPSMDDLDMSMV